MIKLELSQAVFLYLLFTVISVFILWIFFDDRNKLPPLDCDESCVWKCDICTHAYIDSVNGDISKCPLCGSLNERAGRRESSAAL